MPTYVILLFRMLLVQYPDDHSDTVQNNMNTFIAHNKLNDFARIESVRRKFILGEFTIDLDMTNFGYGIGEVEIMVESPDQIQAAKTKIENFCKEMGFTIGVRGKVLEYLYRNSPGHFQALLDSGLVGRKLRLQK